MEDPQLVLLFAGLVVDILDLQALRSSIQHPADHPVFRVVELALWDLGGRRGGLGLYVDVHSLLGGYLLVALGGLLQVVDGDEALRRGAGLGLGERAPHPGHLLLPVGEHGAGLVHAGARADAGPRADGRQGGALVVLLEPVLEAVVAVAARAVDAGDEAGADAGPARGGGAVLLGDAVAQHAVAADAVLLRVGEPLALGPGAGAGAFVGGLGAVVEAEGLGAGLAEEGEEVELVAVLGLAVLADERGVGVLGAVVDRGHLGDLYVGRLLGVGGFVVGGHFRLGGGERARRRREDRYRRASMAGKEW